MINQGTILGSALPEIILLVGVVALFAFGLFAKRVAYSAVTGMSMGLLLIAAVAVVGFSGEGTHAAFYSSFIVDDFSRMLKALLLCVCVIMILFADAHMRLADHEDFRTPISIILGALGMMIMISSHNLLSLFIGVELTTISLCWMIYSSHGSAKAAVSGKHYVRLSMLSSAFLFAGILLFYFSTSALNYEVIHWTLTQSDGLTTPVLIGSMFIVAALSFKLCSVPFHGGVLDVAKGFPTYVSAHLLTAPVIASICVLARLATGPFETISSGLEQTFLILCLLSLLVGSLAIFSASNIKEFFGYTAITHVGFLLLGLASGSDAGISATIGYLVVYAIMMIGTFACVMATQRDGMPVYELSEYAGLSQVRPVLAALFAVLLLSHAGLPWFAGFFAKIYIFIAAIGSGHIITVLLVSLAAVISIHGPIRIIKSLYFDKPSQRYSPVSPDLFYVMFGSGLFVFTYIVFAGLVQNVTRAATMSLL